MAAARQCGNGGNTEHCTLYCTALYIRVHYTPLQGAKKGWGDKGQGRGPGIMSRGDIKHSAVIRGDRPRGQTSDLTSGAMVKIGS